MHWYGGYVGFPSGMTDHEIVMALPEKLKELFDRLLPCMKNVDWSTLTFIVKHYFDDCNPCGIDGQYSAIIGMKFKADKPDE